MKKLQLKTLEEICKENKGFTYSNYKEFQITKINKGSEEDDNVYIFAELGIKGGFNAPLKENYSLGAEKNGVVFYPLSEYRNLIYKFFKKYHPELIVNEVLW